MYLSNLICNCWVAYKKRNQKEEKKKLEKVLHWRWGVNCC